MKAFVHLLILAFFLSLMFTGCKTDGFSSEEAKLILASEAHTLMSLNTIEEKSDSLLLRQLARKVKLKHIGSATLEHLKNRMLATVNDSLYAGVGIAAPQVGIGIQMIYVQRFDKQGEPFEVYYNPVIESYGDSINSGREGCLSVPNYRGKVDRSQNIILSYLDSLGNSQTEKINEFTAVIFQHEIDHINGVLYFDHIYNGFESLSFVNEY